MRVATDTNVLISAIFWKNRLLPFFKLINERQITLVFSLQTIDELYRVIAYERIFKKIKEQSIDPFSIIDTLVSSSVIVRPRHTPSVISDDPTDNAFLACAAEVLADFIISGDKHLLRLKSYKGIPILTPQQFLGQIKVHR